MNKKVLSALIGLVGAIGSFGKTASTDTTIRTALLHAADDRCIAEIRREKFRISPNCASCQAPCGNTSDYPIEAFATWTAAQKTLKAQIMDELLRIVENGNPDTALPDIVLKGIAYMGYDLEEEAYRKLLEELKGQSCP